MLFAVETEGKFSVRKEDADRGVVPLTGRLRYVGRALMGVVYDCRSTLFSDQVRGGAGAEAGKILGIKEVERLG